MILVAVVWSGNELVGKKGIESMGSWPYDAPDGDHHERLMDYVQAELVGFAADCHRYAVHSAAVVSAPDPADYSFATGGAFASWMNQLSGWFQDEVYPSQIGKCRLRLININVLTNRLELRDQWHADKSDENANHRRRFYKASRMMSFAKNDAYDLRNCCVKLRNDAYCSSNSVVSTSNVVDQEMIPSVENGVQSASLECLSISIASATRCSTFS